MFSFQLASFFRWWVEQLRDYVERYVSVPSLGLPRQRYWFSLFSYFLFCLQVASALRASVGVGIFLAFGLGCCLNVSFGVDLLFFLSCFSLILYYYRMFFFNLHLCIIAGYMGLSIPGGGLFIFGQFCSSIAYSNIFKLHKNAQQGSLRWAPFSYFCVCQTILSCLIFILSFLLFYTFFSFMRCLCDEFLIVNCFTYHPPVNISFPLLLIQIYCNMLQCHGGSMCLLQLVH